MSTSDNEKLLENGTLSVELADKYLKIYVADIDWVPHITQLWNNSLKKNGNETVAKEYIRRAISCATILPLVEKTQIPDPPSNLLFWCTRWKQFEQDDWFELLKSIVKEDIEIVKKRNKVLSLGIVDPIDILPINRQAFNWLYEKILTEESLSEYQMKDARSKVSNLIRAYGGAVICYMFMKHQHSVDTVLNWRTGYFFEKKIHSEYSIDQINKIKSTELSKVNKKYIKKIEKAGV